MDMQKHLKHLLSTQSENEVLEFKEAKNDYTFNKLGKYFSALSNEANLHDKDNAWLIFGVNDKKNIVGTSYRDKGKDLQNLKFDIANKTTNRITFINIREVPTPQGRVIMFEIPPAPKGFPIAWEGHYYGRDGESLGPLNMEEIERIRNQGHKTDWSAQICKNATLDDLSTEALKKAREEFTKKNPKLKPEISNWDNITFLNKSKLTIKDQITRTAIILLGKPESEYLISPSVAHITWILNDRDNIKKDYEHFSCPFLLNVEKVRQKIRNITYRYITHDTLFPDEVDSFDPFIIREALNNCIAHQDYTKCGRIHLIESEDSQLIFTNQGSFIPVTIEKVIQNDAPESIYRNPFLANAMVNLNMIDTMGSGISNMFRIQKNKFFPLPDYNLENEQVKVTITGKVLDINYARKLAQMPELLLDQILLLDKLSKHKPLTKNEEHELKSNNLAEGRSPNLHISSHVAQNTSQKSDYIKMRGFNDAYYQEMILNYIKEFGEGKSKDFEELLRNKLPDILDDKQKYNKVRNCLQILKNKGLITCQGKIWRSNS